MKDKLNDLVRLHKAIEQNWKTTSFSEQIQIPIFIADKWSWLYCSEFLHEHLVWTSYEIKKVGGILAKPAPKKGNYHHWNTSTSNEDVNFNR